MFVRVLQSEAISSTVFSKVSSISPSLVAWDIFGNNFYILIVSVILQVWLNLHFLHYRCCRCPQALVLFLGIGYGYYIILLLIVGGNASATQVVNLKYQTIGGEGAYIRQSNNGLLSESSSVCDVRS